MVRALTFHRPSFHRPSFHRPSFHRPMLALAMACAIFAFTVAAPASADVIDPDEEACLGVKKGEACKSPGTGTCEPAQCCKLDYSNRDDAGSPGTKCTECLKCKAGGSADAGAAPPADTGAGGDTGAAADTGSGVSADTGGGSNTSSTTFNDSGCSVGGHTVPWTTLLSLIAGLLGVILLRRRRA